MNFLLLIWLVPVALLLLFLAWSLSRPFSQVASSSRMPPLEAADRQQLTYISQIRMALGPADFDFLAAAGRRKLAHRLHRERRRVALSYLESLRGDFDQALHTIRVVAMLSPDLAASHEFERFRLSVRFYALYYLFRLRLRLGIAALSQLDRLSSLVGQTSYRIEAAMMEMGERAALAAELGSSGDRRSPGLG